MLLYLNAGYSIYDMIKLRLLGKNVEKSSDFNVGKWLNDNNLTMVKYLLDFLPLQQALQCHLQINRFKQEFTKGLIKLLSYPALQLVLAFALSVAAQYWLLPLLHELLGDMGISSGNVRVFATVINVINIVIIGLLIIAVISWLVLRQLESSILQLLLDKPLFQLIKNLLVYQFVNYYLILYQSTASIELIISGMRKLPQAKYLNAYATAIHFKLNNGEELSKAFCLLDKKLEMLFNVGQDTGRITELLSSYVKALNLQFENAMKKIARNFQIFSYLYITLLVVLIYQMMLLPLSLIERM